MNANWNCNKYGVPYHGYSLELADGREIIMDVGTEEDWGNIQEMNNDDGEWFKEGRGKVPTDWGDRVGWGNDADGHVEIVDVFDCETEDHLDPMEWAKECVWCYVKNYSA